MASAARSLPSPGGRRTACPRPSAQSTETRGPVGPRAILWPGHLQGRRPGCRHRPRGGPCPYRSGEEGHPSRQQ
eukprot:2131311-Alexandrium_andersonii.AAC.1